MFKLVLPIIVLILIISSVKFVAAKSENSSKGSDRSEAAQTVRNENGNSQDPRASAVSTGQNEGSPSAEGCDPGLEWRNHGAYVSCVARLHQGGATVSAAARSDIGKKNSTSSASLTPTPTGTESATITPSPTATASVTTTTNFSAPTLESFNEIVHSLKDLLKQFRALFSLGR
ncbi:MAG: hypothetical protein Q7S44_01340 [bacterium]|nr:hypothetical protein [bacterium]